MSRVVAVALPLAALIAATGGNIEPDSLQAVAAVGWVLGLLALGVIGGWRALPVFVVIHVVTAAVFTELFWEPAVPDEEGDYSPASGLIFTVPMTLLVLAVGALAQDWRPGIGLRRR